ncbi:MAG: hypothetical protein E6G51_11200 [Actinobacteria bacterium]|nr:MAG: hypothetical protein E6G51_11200 [Actinomycetota bacterium]
MNTRTAVIGVGLVVVAIVLFVVLGGDSDNGSDSSTSADSTTSAEAAKVPTIVVNKQGEPVGGVADLTYKKGDQIHFKVEVPFEEEVHLHGYDVMKEVPKGGGTVTYDLPAELEGVFEAELEGQGEQIVELKVEP